MIVETLRTVDEYRIDLLEITTSRWFSRYISTTVVNKVETPVELSQERKCNGKSTSNPHTEVTVLILEGKREEVVSSLLVLW